MSFDATASGDISNKYVNDCTTIIASNSNQLIFAWWVFGEYHYELWECPVGSFGAAIDVKYPGNYAICHVATSSEVYHTKNAKSNLYLL